MIYKNRIQVKAGDVDRVVPIGGGNYASYETFTPVLETSFIRRRIASGDLIVQEPQDLAPKPKEINDKKGA